MEKGKLSDIERKDLLSVLLQLTVTDSSIIPRKSKAKAEQWRQKMEGKRKRTAVDYTSQGGGPGALDVLDLKSKSRGSKKVKAIAAAAEESNRARGRRTSRKVRKEREGSEAKRSKAKQS